VIFSLFSIRIYGYIFKHLCKYNKQVAKLSNIKLFDNHIQDDIQDDGLISIDSSFYKDGLSFKCTGCGGCCQMDGEVWLDSNEFLSLTTKLGLPAEDVLDIYVDEIIAGWVKLKNSAPTTIAAASSNKDLLVSPNIATNDMIIEQCIFLEKDTKRCTIYESRPVQCRTYPYWPTIIAYADTWKNEALLPSANHIDKDSVIQKQWTFSGNSAYYLI